MIRLSAVYLLPEGVSEALIGTFEIVKIVRADPCRIAQCGGEMNKALRTSSTYVGSRQAGSSLSGNLLERCDRNSAIMLTHTVKLVCWLSIVIGGGEDKFL